MAKIQVTFDTKEKTIEAMIDGQMIQNIVDVYGYREVFDEKEDPIFTAAVTTREQIDESTMRIVRFVSASSNEARAALADGNAIHSDKFPDMIGIQDMTKAQKDIESFFGPKMGVL